MKTLKIGIAGYDRMKARTMAIARGTHKPARDEPKVWFTSIESFAKVLSGRSKSNLSRTLKTMSLYGLVELNAGERGTLVPRVPYDQVRLDVSLTATPRQVAR